jgi:hypothetical protein
MKPDTGPGLCTVTALPSLPFSLAKAALNVIVALPKLPNCRVFSRTCTHRKVVHGFTTLIAQWVAGAQGVCPAEGWTRRVSNFHQSTRTNTVPGIATFSAAMLSQSWRRCRCRPALETGFKISSDSADPSLKRIHRPMATSTVSSALCLRPPESP